MKDLESILEEALGLYVCGKNDEDMRLFWLMERGTYRTEDDLIRVRYGLLQPVYIVA